MPQPFDQVIIATIKSIYRRNMFRAIDGKDSTKKGIVANYQVLQREGYFTHDYGFLGHHQVIGSHKLLVQWILCW